MKRLVEITRKLYWREADGREVVTAWRRSGLSKRRFASEIGIQRERLARWAKRLDVGGEPEVAFHPVRLVEKASRAQDARIELVVGGGIVVPSVNYIVPSTTTTPRHEAVAGAGASQRDAQPSELGGVLRTGVGAGRPRCWGAGAK
ncbi:MAG: hypothetical protein U0166_02815 [Acidobacteriota bacterium]